METHYTLAEEEDSIVLRCPYVSKDTSIQVRNGSGGGLVLLQDTQLIETLTNFSRARIPERTFIGIANLMADPMVNRAFGVFEVTITAPILLQPAFSVALAKKQRFFCGFLPWDLKEAQLILSEMSTVRLLKFTQIKATWTGSSIIQDPIKFPSLNRSHKRHPRTNMPDANMFWE
ncbi:hypothetical protein V1522DRAFT_393293 [Lipomyces starkeyi]